MTKERKTLTDADIVSHRRGSGHGPKVPTADADAPHDPSDSDAAAHRPKTDAVKAGDRAKSGDKAKHRDPGD